MDEAGRMVAFPSLKKPLWEDLKATVPRWFHEHGGLGDMHSKAYSHFRTIAPCQGKGPVKFLAWMKELALLIEDPLPVDDPVQSIVVALFSLAPNLMFKSLRRKL